MMDTTAEIKNYQLLQRKSQKEEAEELVTNLKHLTQDDLAERIESKVISTLTRRLLFFFFAQVGFTMGLLKFVGAV